MDEAASSERDGNARRRVLGATLLLIVQLAMLAAAYFLIEGGRVDQRQVSSPAADGDPFRLSFWPAPRAVPNLNFADGDGRALALADFRGRPVVLNIWATWCVPCRREMPTLERLQANFDKSVLLVLPLSIDRPGAAAVRRFYERLGLKALGVYVDPSGKAADEIDAPGIPTTLLLDREGREIGRKIGPADWDSPAMITLLRERLGIAAGGQGSGS